MKDDRLYLVHIVECITRIHDYTAPGRAEFLRSTLIQDAVMRNLQILTESSQRVSEELKADHPGVDWRAMAGFRNVLVHDYLSIDLAIVWNVIERDLPGLKRQIQAILDAFAE